MNFSTATAAPPPGSNRSASGADDDEDDEESWLQVLHVITLTLFISFGTYIVWALLRYERNIKNASRKRGRTGSHASLHPLGRPGGRSHFIKRWLIAVDAPTLASKMRMCSIASPLCATFLFSAQLIYELLHIFAEEIHVCEIMTNLIFTLLTWSTVFIYLLLWLRQRSIYTNSAKHLTTTTGRALSVCTLILIVLDAFLVPVFFGIGRHFLLKGNKCHVTSDSRLHFYYIIVTSFLSIVFHVSLLYLFASPLLRHTAAGGKQQQQQGSGGRLAMVTRRACYVTLYGVIVDVSIILSTAVLSTGNEKMQALLEDAILLSGVVTVLLTFVNWRERLFPVECLRRRPKSSSASSSAASAAAAAIGGASNHGSATSSAKESAGSSAAANAKVAKVVAV